MKRVVAVCIAALLATPAGAHEPAKGGDKALAERTPIQHYRHETMEAVGGHMSALGDIMDGEVDRGPRDVLAHAVAMHETSQIYGELFPAGSGPEVGRTDALAAIWEKPEEFAAALTAFQDATAALVEVSKRGNMDDIKAAFPAVGKSCGGCHKPFKQRD